MEARMPMDLENEISALPTVQAHDITTTNGCRVTLEFSEESMKGTRKDVAKLLLAAFEKRRSKMHEEGTMPVQSINQRTG